MGHFGQKPEASISTGEFDLGQYPAGTTRDWAFIRTSNHQFAHCVSTVLLR